MPISKEDRARIFMPFNALTGFKEAILAKEKIVVSKKELSEDSLKVLDYKIKQVKKGMMCTVIYFEKDEYIKVIGLVSKIDFDSKILTIVKTKISFNKIMDIKCESIKEYDEAID